MSSVKISSKFFDNQVSSNSLLTTDQLAELLQVSPKTIRKWRYQDKLPADKIKRLVRYKWKDILEWLSVHGGES